MKNQNDMRVAVSSFAGILWQFWKNSRCVFFVVIVIVIGSSLLSVCAPYFFSRLIDHMATDRWKEAVFMGFIFYAFLIGLSLALKNTMAYLVAMSAEDLNFIASTAFFERLINKSSDFFVKHNPAEIQSAQIQGAQAINVVLQLALMAVIPGFVQLALTLAILGAVVDARVVLIVLVYGTVLMLLTYFSNIWATPHLDKAVTAAQRNAQVVGNAISSIETLRYFESSAWMSSRFRSGAHEVFTNWRSYCLKKTASAVVHGVALALQLAITFAIFLPRYREGMMSVGDIVLFNALLLQLNHPLEMMGLALEGLVRSYTQFKPFSRMWGFPEECDRTPLRGKLPRGSGRLEFMDVSFSYEDGRGITGTSFTAERGLITFITGETGVGKSTIIKLALKAIEPLAGEIRVDGVNLGEINRHDWYAAIGVVPQEVILLNDTLSANIVLGRPINEMRLREASAKAALLERIQELPEGFSTVVGERGLKLSGGERQRIAIARALYGEPEFLFLDEASSALDDATETAIMEHLRRIAGDVTILAITHRKNAMRGTDRVIVLQRRA